jgi:tRNA/rRNA methyltransferase
MAEVQTKGAGISPFLVVLCRAEEAGNVGSVCRAMKTMGLDRLVLVGAPDYDRGRVATMAVHAFDIYERALRFPELPEALAGTALSAGFTRRRGERRKTFSLPVDEFSASVQARRGQGEVALVFGNERSGLSGEELEACSLAVHIPTSEDFPSLNLAQAVQIAAWELRRQDPGLRAGGYAAAPRAQVLATVERASERLEGLGFFRLNQGAELKAFLRDLAERAALSPSELRYFESFIHKMAGLASREAGPPRDR